MNKWFIISAIRRRILLFLILLFPAASFAQPADSLRWYAGDTHVHTYIHAVSTIEERAQEGIAGGLDWVAITRHKRSGAFWKAHEVDGAYDRHYPRIAPILGMEWDEPPELGREDIIILGVNRLAPIPEDNLQSVIDWTNREGGVFIFAHPSQFVFDNIHRWHSYIAFEGYSGPQWNPACAPGGAWDALLTQGDRLFIVGASDNHGQPYLGNRIVKTYVLARSNRPDDIIEGIRAGRVYVSEKDQVRLEFRVAGRMMGETVAVDGTTLPVHISAEASAPITGIRLISNGMQIWADHPNTAVYAQRFQLTVPPALRYIRLIVETAGTRTMGNPVFLDQAGAMRTTTPAAPKHPLAEWRGRVQPGQPLQADIYAAMQAGLKDADPRARMNAAYGLVAFDAPDATGSLFTLAGDADPKARAYAARMLAGRATAEDLPRLRRLLSDEDAQVRLWAVRALERIGAPQIRPILLEMIDDNAFWVQFAAVEGLVDFGARDATVFDDLEALVKEGNLNASMPFNWGPAVRKRAMVDYLQGKYERQDRDRALYLALERLGAPPARNYSMTSQRVTVPPVLDGRLNESIWQGAPAITLEQDDISNTGRVETRAHVLYDDRALYVAFRCSSLPAGRQDVEFVLIGFDTNTNGGIDYTFEIDRNGRVQGVKDGITEWNRPVQAAVSAVEDGWIVEIAIPYASIAWSGPVAGRTWGFNLGYGIRGQNTRLTSWSPTLGQPQNATRYGSLIFGE